jgi:Mn-dependent DtxR family transcriptional regulator
MAGRAEEPDERPPSAVEDYVKAIYVRKERGLAVTTTALAAELEVTASSASAMSGRLREMRSVTHRLGLDATRLRPAELELTCRVRPS